MLVCMFGLTPTLTAIIFTVILAVVALAYLLFGWLRKRSWRVMLRGIGFVLIPVGLLAMGLMTQIVNGLQAVVDWANATVMNGWIMLGLILGGIGLVAYLVGSFVPHVTGDEAASRRAAIKARRLASLQTQPQPTGPAPMTTPPPSQSLVPATASQTPSQTMKITPVAQPNMTDDDKEVDDILRRHGIS